MATVDDEWRRLNATGAAPRLRWTPSLFFSSSSWEQRVVVVVALLFYIYFYYCLTKILLITIKQSTIFHRLGAQLLASWLTGWTVFWLLICFSVLFWLWRCCSKWKWNYLSQFAYNKNGSFTSENYIKANAHAHEHFRHFSNHLNSILYDSYPKITINPFVHRSIGWTASIGRSIDRLSIGS